MFQPPASRGRSRTLQPSSNLNPSANCRPPSPTPPRTKRPPSSSRRLHAVAPPLAAPHRRLNPPSRAPASSSLRVCPVACATPVSRDVQLTDAGPPPLVKRFLPRPASRPSAIQAFSVPLFGTAKELVGAFGHTHTHTHTHTTHAHTHFRPRSGLHAQ